MPGMSLMGIFFLILFFAIGVLILRWAFRINDIINRLDSIINALKAGLKIEETK